jgi:general secretion pathway protein F
MLAALVLFAVAIVWAFRRTNLRATLSRLMWRVPGMGERLRVLELARCYRTLGMLQRGGIAIVPALEMVAGLLSPQMRPQLQRATVRIREGSPTSQAMEAENLTTQVAARMLRVGERAGNMGEMMERIAAFHDEEIGRWVEWVTRLFGPLLMLVIGLFIGVIVVLMYLPIFQLAESLG